MTTLRRQVKNMVKNYSEAEVKVREATSNDPWGPSSTLMSEISDLTYNIVALGEVMRMIWKRLNDHGKNWRHVYKSLVLLDYLIKNGNEKVAQQCKEHIVAIQTLKDFQHMEEQKDQGQSVREKAKQLVNLLRDDERLKQERTKAFKARERFAQNAMGISSDNKMTYATSVTSSQASQNRSTYGSGKGGNYSDPYGGAGASAVPDPLAADLEAVRPSDSNEEDLQIKLAIMLSQQEAEEDTQKKRSDDAKLSLAIEQSKSEGQPNGLVDLADSGFGGSNNDPWGSNQLKAPVNNNMKLTNDQELDSGSEELFPPLFNNNNNNKAQQQLDDPWGASSNNNSQNNGLAQLGNPWLTPNDQNIPAANVLQTNADPWAVPTTQQQMPTKADDFDLFTSDRAVNQSPLTNSNQNNTNNSNADPFGDFFGSTNIDQNNSNTSTNPWNATDALKPTEFSNQPSNGLASSFDQSKTNGNNNNSFAQAAAQRKTPESFLGDNASLVNLENLIPARPKSTNPFGGNQPSILSTAQTGGLTQSNSSGQLHNPFLAQQALQNQNQPTISQLQSQQKQSQQSAFPSFGQQQPQSSTFGQLPQPLIPPSNSIPNMSPLAFNSQAVLAPTPPPQATMQQQQPFNGFNSNNNPTQNSSTNPFLMM